MTVSLERLTTTVIVRYGYCSKRWPTLVDTLVRTLAVEQNGANGYLCELVWERRGGGGDDRTDEGDILAKTPMLVVV